MDFYGRSLNDDFNEEENIVMFSRHLAEKYRKQHSARESEEETNESQVALNVYLDIGRNDISIEQASVNSISPVSPNPNVSSPNNDVYSSSEQLPVINYLQLSTRYY